MSSILFPMLFAWVLGFALSAFLVLPFAATREVKEIARLSAD